MKTNNWITLENKWFFSIKCSTLIIPCLSLIPCFLFPFIFSKQISLFGMYVLTFYLYFLWRLNSVAEIFVWDKAISTLPHHSRPRGGLCQISNIENKLLALQRYIYSWEYVYIHETTWLLKCCTVVCIASSSLEETLLRNFAE